MQNRYAFDFGDFGKFSLLRTLAPGRTVGLCWYLCEGGPREPDGDGRFIGYLDESQRYASLDPEVFRAFASGFTGERSVGALEALNLVPGAVYHRAPVPRGPEERRGWFADLSRAIEACDLVLTDPDNGFEPGRLGPKSIAWSEVEALMRPSRALLLYHHQTRRRGGAGAEFSHFADVLRAHGARSVQAVRLRPFSSRFYFLVDGEEVLGRRLRAFAERWGNAAELYV